MIQVILKQKQNLILLMINDIFYDKKFYSINDKVAHINCIMVFIKTLVEGKIVVAGLIDTTSHFNIISKELFDKLKSKHGIRPVSKYVKRYEKDVIGEINCLDLQFYHKGKYRSLYNTDTIEFKIDKLTKHLLILGQSWLMKHKVKIDLHNNVISIYGMRIPILDDGDIEDYSNFPYISSSESDSSSSDLDDKDTLDAPGTLKKYQVDHTKRSEGTRDIYYHAKKHRNKKSCSITD